MEVQEQALNKLSKGILDNLEATLAEAFPVENITADMQSLLEKLDGIDFCREIALDQTAQRLSRLLSNTANQSAK